MNKNDILYSKDSQSREKSIYTQITRQKWMSWKVRKCASSWRNVRLYEEGISLDGKLRFEWGRRNQVGDHPEQNQRPEKVVI